MNNVLLLLISLAIINLNFLPNSFGRFILVEVDQKEVKRTKSGAVEKCLKEEGIPDVCLGIFKTGNGTEECNEWIDTNPGLIEMTDARLKKCVSQSTSEMARWLPDGCSQACHNCYYCMVGGPILMICLAICIAANCEVGEWPCCAGLEDCN